MFCLCIDEEMGEEIASKNEWSLEWQEIGYVNIFVKSCTRAFCVFFGFIEELMEVTGILQENREHF